MQAMNRRIPTIARVVLAVMSILTQPCAAVPLPVLQRLASLPREQPLLFGVGVTSVKTAAADVLTQRAALRRRWSDLDWSRACVFAVYGALYLGGVQHFLFVHLYPRLLPLASRFAAAPFAAKLRDPRGLASVLAQVACDQGLHWPLSAIPCFYLVKGLGEREPLAASLSALRTNWRADVLTCWAFWLPADFVSFGVLPLHLQVPFAAAVSFVYTAVVSFRRGERLKHE